MSENESLLLEYKPLITSLIFQEMKRSSIDSIQIICQDGKSMNCSCLLLASLSPLLADIMKHQESQNLVVILPDIDISTLKDTLDSILSLDHKQSILDKQILMLDGIFWEAGHLMKYFADSLTLNYNDPANDNFERETIDTKRDDKNLIDGFDEAYTDNDVAHPLDDLDMFTSFYSDFQLKEDITDEESPRNSELDITYIPDHPYVIKDCFVKIERLPKNEKVKNKKRKISPSHQQKIKKVKEKDCEQEEKDASLIIREKNAQLEKQGFLKRFLIPGIEESQDEEFKAAQERLKLYLEDGEDFEVPRVAWCKFHGLNPDIYLLKNLKKQPKIECPICLLSFSSSKEYDGRQYFDHLRNHKYKTLKCPCRPPGSFSNTNHEIANHIKIAHWGWVRCQHCNRPVDPNDLKFHHLIRHREEAELLACHVCQMTISQKGNSGVNKYKMHMDNHTTNKKFMCEICNITYIGENHQVYHDQVVHIGELLGCKSDRCYFTCKTEKEMNEHVITKHSSNTTSENEQKHSICDICGFVSKSRDGIYHHKKLQHDYALIQCTKCPKMCKSIGNLNKHMQVHQEKSVCTICGVKVKRMNDHIKLHIPYDKCKFNCKPCKKGFMKRGDLRTHMMNVHLKERPYSCRYGCMFAYNDLSNRNQHEKKKHGKLFSFQEITEV